MSEKNWSAEVQDIFSRFDAVSDNVIINACPGAGKTTVLQALWERSIEPTVYLAFGKANADEAKGKFPPKEGSEIATLHAFGLRALSKVSKVKVDKYKVSNIIRNTLEHKWPERERTERRYELMKLVGLIKNNGLLTLNSQDIADIIYDYDIDEYPGMMENSQRVMDISNNERHIIDFDDMLYLPVFYELELSAVPLCLVDEAQDLNPIQFALVERMKGSRFIFVGDKRQSIYAFRGSLPDAMESIQARFNCVDMPMTLSYRCPQEIVKLAQQYYPNDIRALPNASLGAVSHGEYQDTNYQPSDLVLCRNNAPLIEKAYSLLRQGIRCQVRGRDIGGNFLKYLKKFSAQDKNHLFSLVEEDIESQKATARRKENQDKIDQLDDKLRTIEVFVDTAIGSSCEDVYQTISDLFDQKSGVLLSTIHKAKGLEAERIYWLDSALAHLARKNESVVDRIQRQNLCYVAVTRSKDKLTYINSKEKNND